MSTKELMVGGKLLSSLRVVDLKEELEKRGLSKSGSKKDLADRLKKSLLLENQRNAQSLLADDEQLPNISTREQLAENPFLRDYFESQAELYHSQKVVKKLYEDMAHTPQEEQQPAVATATSAVEQVKEASPSPQISQPQPDPPKEPEKVEEAQQPPVSDVPSLETTVVPEEVPPPAPAPPDSVQDGSSSSLPVPLAEPDITPVTDATSSESLQPEVKVQKDQTSAPVQLPVVPEVVALTDKSDSAIDVKKEVVKSEVESESGPVTVSKSAPEPKSESASDPKSEISLESDSVTAPEPKTNSEISLKSESVAAPESKSDSEISLKSEAVAAPESKSDSEISIKSESVAAPESKSDSEISIKSEAVTAPEPKSESAPVPEPQSAAAPEPESPSIAVPPAAAESKKKVPDDDTENNRISDKSPTPIDSIPKEDAGIEDDRKEDQDVRSSDNDEPQAGEESRDEDDDEDEEDDSHSRRSGKESQSSPQRQMEDDLDYDDEESNDKKDEMEDSKNWKRRAITRSSASPESNDRRRRYRNSVSREENDKKTDSGSTASGSSNSPSENPVLAEKVTKASASSRNDQMDVDEALDYGEEESDVKRDHEEFIWARRILRLKNRCSILDKPEKKWNRGDRKPVVVTSKVLEAFFPDVKPLPESEVKLEERILEPVLEQPQVIEPEPEVAKDNSLDDDTLPNVKRKISIIPYEETVKELTPPRNAVTNILVITNLTRPFTLMQLKELLQRTGTIEDIWVDKIKSKCLAKFESQSDAEETRSALHGIKWPPSNPKALVVDFTTVEEFNQVANEKEDKNIKIEKPKEAKILPVREWDLGKRSRSRSPGRTRRRSGSGDRKRVRRSNSPHSRRSPYHDKKSRDHDIKEETQVKALDELFRKTTTTPCLYWLPLTPEQISEKEELRRKRMVERERRLAEMEKLRPR